MTFAVSRPTATRYQQVQTQSLLVVKNTAIGSKRLSLMVVIVKNVDTRYQLIERLSLMVVKSTATRYHLIERKKGCHLWL